MTTPVRADALPEFHQYVDDGCAFHPKCITCPAAECRYDTTGGIRSLRNARRDSAIVRERRREGLAVEVLSQCHGLSVRTVYRILAAARRAA